MLLNFSILEIEGWKYPVNDLRVGDLQSTIRLWEKGVAGWEKIHHPHGRGGVFELFNFGN